MSKKPLTPDRMHLLEAYCACLKRAERRIIIAGARVNGRSYDPRSTVANSKIVLSLRKRMKERGMEAFTTALMCLRIKRSRFAAELQGKQW